MLSKSCKGKLSSKSSLIIKIYAFAEKLTDLPRNRHNISQSLTKRLGAFPWSFALEAVLGTVEESGLEPHISRMKRENRKMLQNLLTNFLSSTQVQKSK
jgi:hypothetical protein